MATVEVQDEVLRSQRRALSMVGQRADTQEGRRLGRTVAVLVEWRTGDPRWLVVDIPRRHHAVAVPMAGVVAGGGSVYVPRARAAVLAGPPITNLDHRHVIADHELLAHHGLPAAQRALTVPLTAPGVWMRGGATKVPRGERVRVVLCDDAEPFRRLLTLTLEEAGDIEVVGQAGNGREVVGVVLHAQPDVVLLDVTMPVVGGLEALPVVQAVAPDAEVVCLTGFGTPALAAELQARGATAYLEKGIDLHAIAAAVRTAGGIARARRRR